MARRLEAAPHGGRALLLPADGGRRGGEAAAGQNSLQQVGGGRLLDVVLEDAVRVAVAADRKVKVVGGPATADHRVELFAGHQLVDDSVGGVGGDALGGVNGGGVAELDGLPHVVTGEGDGFAGAQVVRSEFAVGGESSDGPPVAVADPVAAVGEAAVIEAGDDQVADTGPIPIGEVGLKDRPVAAEARGAGPFVEICDLTT